MPLTFCNCDVCKESRKLGGKNIRKRSSMVINDELMIDLGPDSINACTMYGIDAGRIMYLLQTHSHSYHFDGGHLDAGMIADYVRKMNEDNIIDDNSLVYGTHFSHEGNNIHDKMEELAVQNSYHIAYDGMKIEI